MSFKTYRGRITSKEGQVQNLPRGVGIKTKAVWEHIMVVFPGKDGIGPDFIDIKDWVPKKQKKESE